MPEELTPMLKEYKSSIEKDIEDDPANLIGYLQTMQLAILSGGICLRLLVLEVVK